VGDLGGSVKAQGSGDAGAAGQAQAGQTSAASGNVRPVLERSSESRVLRHSTPSLYYSGCFGSLGEDALVAATTIVNAKVFDGTKSQD
jgi:hypothetical protein